MPESDENPALEAGPSEATPKRSRTPSSRYDGCELTPQVKKTGVKLGPGTGHGVAGGNAPHKRPGCSRKANGTPNQEGFSLSDGLKQAQVSARQVAGFDSGFRVLAVSYND